MSSRDPLTSLSVGAAALLLTGSAAARAAVTGIQLKADNSVIQADGRSAAVITAQILDDRGLPAPDGTRVRFSTTAGRLDASLVTTQNGVARVTLTAGDQPGIAIVTVVLEAAGPSVPTSINITFSSDANNASAATAWAHVDGDYVGYAADSRIIQANRITRADDAANGASFDYRGFKVSADVLQYNVEQNVIKAVGGDIVVSVGKVARHYLSLRYDLLQNAGQGERLEDGRLRTYLLRGTDLNEVPLDAPAPASAASTPPASAPAIHRNAEPVRLDDLSGAGVMVVARSIAVEPGRMLQFRRATFYLDGEKAWSLPYHVMSLDQKSLFQDQVLGFGPTGLAVDVPLYYDVRPSGVGTLHVLRGARLGSSSYSTRPGWNFDLVQDYNGRHGSEGTLELTGVTHNDWSMRLRHDQRLDPMTTGGLTFEFPNNRDMFLSTHLSRVFRDFQLTGSGYGSHTGGIFDALTGTKSLPGGGVRGQLSAMTNTRPFLGQHWLGYSFNAGIARQSFYGGGSSATVAPVVTPPGSLPPGVISVPVSTPVALSGAGTYGAAVTTKSAGGQLNTSPLVVARDTSLVQSLSLGQTWVTGPGSSGISLLGTTTLNRRLGSLGSTSLSYDYAQSPLTYGGASASGRQRVGMNVFLAGNNSAWGLNLLGSRVLDAPQSSISGDLSFAIAGPWRGAVRLNAGTFSGFAYKDIEYRLIRKIQIRNLGSRDVAVYYSTTTRRLQFDLVSGRF